VVAAAVNRRQNTLGRPLLRQGHPLHVRIEAKTVTQDDYGQEEVTWAAVVSDVAFKTPLTANELQALNYTATDRVWSLFLADAYPQITTRHRAVIDGRDIYDIDAVEADQIRMHTRLQVRQVTT